MRTHLAFLAAGAIAATVVMISCSDDSPADADAAVCDCDPAEPPLAGRIMRVEDRSTGAIRVLTAIAICPVGSTLLGGGCYSEGAGALNVRLIQSGDPQGGDTLRYGCTWENPPELELTVVSFATCLIPAP